MVDPADSDTTSIRIQLRGDLDRRLIRNVFDQRHRVHIPACLEDSAARFGLEVLRHRTSWRLSVNSSKQHYDVHPEQIAALPTARQVLMLDAINEGARHGFQYAFNNFPMHDVYVAGERAHPLMRFYEFLNSPSFLDFAREVTGCADIAFADAQATLYRPGHFLTVHDDDVSGKHRRVAYVLNFTETWRADWGGILQFIDQDGHVAEGYTPMFNSLNLLRVPQKHCVSYVAPAAANGRYSITGWLRAH